MGVHYGYRPSGNFPFIPTGQQAYTTPGTYSWTAPAEVTSVCVVCVGAGGGGAQETMYARGGGGGGLGWKNNISVVPGQSYTVQVGSGGSVTVGIAGAGQAGGNSYFIDVSTVAGFGGDGGTQQTGDIFGGLGGTYVGDGGGNGGQGGAGGTYAGGGGGAGGYSGNGGSGYVTSSTGLYSNGNSGTGGGGGGGGSCGSGDTAGAGGGVGIYGEGASGSYGAGTAADGRGGQGGSGGADASFWTTSTTAQNIYSGSTIQSVPGTYGGGGAGSDYTAGYNEAAPGAGGAVRIIWGTGRAFPSTNTGNV